MSADEADLVSIPRSQYLDSHLVFADELKWVPIGDQPLKLKDRSIKILHDKILITKLAENQEIEAELYCTKNVGKTHAKWSPVSTAFYKLLPTVKVVKPVCGEDAEEMTKLCPAGVFDIEETGQMRSLIVKNESSCVTCRACINQERLGECVELGKRANSYLFTVESVGVISPRRLFGKALDVLLEKAFYYSNILKKRLA